MANLDGVADIIPKLKHVNSTEEKANVILGSDGFGIEDYLSRLPDDCLLDMLAYLKRKDICVMMNVSAKIRTFLMKDRSLDKIKWKGGILSIVKTSEGYGFTLWVHSFEYPDLKKKYTIYRYEVIKAEDGTFVEKKLCNPQETIQCTTSGDHLHQWPIPDNFFIALKQILRTHQASAIHVAAIPFNSHFFSNLKAATTGQIIERFNCSDIKDPEMTKDCLRSIAVFMRNVSSAEFDHSGTTTIFDEDLICQIGGSRLKKLTEVKRHWNNFYDSRFYPSEAILKSLIKFNEFTLPSMILNVNWVMNLFMIYLNNASSNQCLGRFRGKWQFSVDQHITQEIISRTIDKFNYEYKIDREGNHCILKRESGLSAKFFCRPVEVLSFSGAVRAHLHVINVFFNNYNPSSEIL